MGLAYKSREAKEIVEEVEAFITLLELSDTQYTYYCNTIVVNALRKIHKMTLYLSYMDVIEIHIEEYNGECELAILSMPNHTDGKRNIKKDLIKMSIGTYRVNRNGRLEITISTAEQVMKILAYFKKELGI